MSLPLFLILVCKDILIMPCFKTKTPVFFCTNVVLAVTNGKNASAGT